MSLKLPLPTNLDPRLRETLRVLELEDSRNRKTNQDVEIGVNKLILTSPNGTRWNVTVDNAGNLVTTAI